MLYSVFALDNPNVAEKRKAIHAEHVAHLKTAKDFRLVLTVGGPLISDDGTMAIGSLMVFDAPDRIAVEKFTRADPFQKNAVWGKIEIQRFDKRTG